MDGVVAIINVHGGYPSPMISRSLEELESLGELGTGLDGHQLVAVHRKQVLGARGHLVAAPLTVGGVGRRVGVPATQGVVGDLREDATDRRQGGQRPGSEALGLSEIPYARYCCRKGMNIADK